LDSNGKALTKKDVKLAMEHFERALLQGGATVDVTTSPVL
jgi:hypothetical protein